MLLCACLLSKPLNTARLLLQSARIESNPKAVLGEGESLTGGANSAESSQHFGSQAATRGSETPRDGRKSPNLQLAAKRPQVPKMGGRSLRFDIQTRVCVCACFLGTQVAVPCSFAHPLQISHPIKSRKLPGVREAFDTPYPKSTDFMQYLAQCRGGT